MNDTQIPALTDPQKVEYRADFLDLALFCGARLSGKPDGSEAIEVIFSIDAWRAFDVACAPAAPVQAQGVALASKAEYRLPPIALNSLTTYPSPHGTLIRRADVECMQSRTTALAQAPQSDDARDAARYRWLTEAKGMRLSPSGGRAICDLDDMNAHIDAAIAALTGSAP